MNASTSRGYAPGLVLGALGVVYGDIGTSPLYALRECFHASHGLAPTPENVLGVLSLIFWALILIVSIKYIGFVLRADNQGEGGILALFALAGPPAGGLSTRRGMYLGLLGLFGAGLLYGDGIITPSLTVLSAVEGVAVSAPSLSMLVVPAALVILALLFAFQHHGTGRMGAAFGPVMLVWFATMAALGVAGLARHPGVLWCVNPLEGLRFLAANRMTGFLVLGAVFLVVTGTEALYADMGHFGRGPIRRAWFAVVLPALFLNYLGQGALLIRAPATGNPFFALAPAWAQIPLVILATVAAVIASQALISGVFSLTTQSVQLGLLPRVGVKHTSSHQRGQIYVPKANGMLFAACVVLTAAFGSSSRLAAAYGIAVSLTMIITSLLFYVVARRRWGWSPLRAGAWLAFFLVVEAAFCGANLLKVAHGGWVPLALALAVFAVMSTWQAGRRRLREFFIGRSLPLETFLADEAYRSVARVPGTAVFMTGNPDLTPLALLHNLKHNRVLHQRNILMTVRVSEAAHVSHGERVAVERLGADFVRVIGTFGFMDEPSVPAVLAAAREHGLEGDPERFSYFLSVETLVPGRRRGMARWRKALFALLTRNAERATAYFGLPANRVVELGMQIEF